RQSIVMRFVLTLILFQAIRSFEASAFENNSRFDWSQEELSNHECRSCISVSVDISNCPYGYECNNDQPLSAAVLTASDECRCLTITCAKRGWRLAVKGSIVHKIRCQGKQWMSATGLLATSVVCAKESPTGPTDTTTTVDITTTTASTTTEPTTTTSTQTTSTATETTTPPLSRNCIPPPEPWRCNKAPFPLAPFSPVCYNDPGDGAYLISKCLNNEVLVLAVPEVPGYYLPSEGATWCIPEKRTYSSVTLSRPRFEEVPQISCMACPYMSGDVPTTFDGAHEAAVYNECTVRCNNGVLKGKCAGTFVAVPADTAYYSYNGPLAKFEFIDRVLNVYDHDFYCETSDAGK
ncbi:hypothetical protein PRIPAC_73718, partial [Pristionchus pacificus]|uniref:Uncharacterized protein n=1 Tax=Pristionchus pacificus TaxID=54126 RepID=A0A2A6B5G9_PRIPA